MNNTINSILRPVYDSLHTRPWGDETGAHTKDHFKPADTRNLNKVVEGNKPTPTSTIEEPSSSPTAWWIDNEISVAQIIGWGISLIAGSAIVYGVLSVRKMLRKSALPVEPGMTINLMEPRNARQRFWGMFSRTRTVAARPAAEEAPAPRWPSVFVGDAELTNFLSERLPRSLFRTAEDGTIHLSEYNPYTLVEELFSELKGNETIQGLAKAFRSNPMALISEDGQFRLHNLTSPFSYTDGEELRIEFSPPVTEECENYRITIEYDFSTGVTYYYDPVSAALVKIEAWNYSNTARMEIDPASGLKSSYVFRNTPDMTPDFLMSPRPLEEIDFNELLRREGSMGPEVTEAEIFDLRRMLEGGKASEAFDAVEVGLTAYFERGLTDAVRLERAREALLKARDVLAELRKFEETARKGRK